MLCPLGSHPPDRAPGNAAPADGPGALAQENDRLRAELRAQEEELHEVRARLLATAEQDIEASTGESDVAVRSR